MPTQPTPEVGARVRIERDETRYPSRGTWPQFRGKTGTVVEVNHDRKRPHLTEYGVIFGKVWPRPDRPGVLRWSGDDTITWFKAYELRPVAQRLQHGSAARTVAA
ncbi:hypothetical protein ABQF34_07245 [Mycolicibacterium boenickei]